MMIHEGLMTLCAPAWITECLPDESSRAYPTELLTCCLFISKLHYLAERAKFGCPVVLRANRQPYAQTPNNLPLNMKQYTEPFPEPTALGRNPHMPGKPKARPGERDDEEGVLQKPLGHWAVSETAEA